MNTKHVLTVVASAAFALLAQTSFAQSTAPSSRADVKAETKAAAAAHTLTPAGEGDNAASGPMTGKSAKTRSQGKAATRQAAKSRELAPAGEHVDITEKPMKSTKSRAEGKADTKAAVKERATTPAGEGVGPKK